MLVRTTPGQVVFCNNPVTGLIIATGIFISSPYNGVMMVLGAVASTLTAMVVQADEASIANGS